MGHGVRICVPNGIITIAGFSRIYYQIRKQALRVPSYSSGKDALPQSLAKGEAGGRYLQFKTPQPHIEALTGMISMLLSQKIQNSCMGTDISSPHRSQERYLEDEKWKSKNHMPKTPTQSSLMLGQASGLGLTQNEFSPFPQA